MTGRRGRRSSRPGEPIRAPRAAAFVASIAWGLAGVGVAAGWHLPVRAHAIQEEARRPERIVSIVPAATEILFAIGAGPRVVAVGSFDDFPPEVAGLPRVGALVDPDVERILSLVPDLVVVYASQRDLVRQLTRAQVRVFEYRHGGLADIGTAIRRLGEVTGEAATADALARRLERGVERIRQHVADRPRPRVLLVFGREPGGLRNIHASGGVGFLHDMLDAAGGENVLAGVARESAQVTTEQVLARRPDVILEVRAVGPTDEASLRREREAWRRLSSLPAVQTGRVVFLSGAEFVVPGPRVVGAIERMAAALHER